METIAIIIFIILYLALIITLSGAAQTGIGAICVWILGLCLAYPAFLLFYAYIWLLIIMAIGGLFLIGSND